MDEQTDANFLMLDDGVIGLCFGAISYMGEQTKADEDTLWDREATVSTDATPPPFLRNAKPHGWLLVAVMAGMLIPFS